MNTQYCMRLAGAYYRGRAVRTGTPELDKECLGLPLEELDDEQVERIVSSGCAADDKLYYFKRSHGELARVKKVMGFLRAIEFHSLLDVGSGRGVFLLPFIEAFPWVSVISMDVLSHRVEFLRDLSSGGITQLEVRLEDICSTGLEEKSVDVVTLLEVLEHIPQVDQAIAAAVRIARKYVVVTVPSKPDNNPEHIHLLTKADLTKYFEAAGCTRLRFDGVNGHLFMVAILEKRRDRM